MHELALAEGILGVVLDAAQNQAVEKVRLQVGSLQFIEPYSLEFAFGVIAEATGAAGAQLEITEIAAVFRCQKCGKENHLSTPPFQCEACLGFELELLTGDQILVDEVVLKNGSTIRRPQGSFEDTLKEHMRQHEE